MSNVPENAQISDDGCWWWDGEDWQEILDGPADDAPDDGVDGGDEGEPAFDFDMGGLRVSPEDSPVESAGEPLKVAFGVCNVGTAGGVATMTLYIDGDEVTEVVWESEWIEAGFCSAPDGDGYVHGVPGLSEGEHLFEAWFDPPGPNEGYAQNTINVGPPED